MKISIITVAYNNAKTIGDTICSVAKQTHADFEHLIIDGVSEDETVSVATSFKNNHMRIISEPDKGMYDAMNKGFYLARGDVIGFLNADDLFSDEMVLDRIAKAFEDPFIEACFGDLFYVTQDNKNIVRYWKSKPYSRGYFARGLSPAHPTFYIRRSALVRLGGFDLTYPFAADIEFMIRYLEVGGVRTTYIPHVLIRMRVGGTSNRSFYNISQQNAAIFRALDQHAVPHLFVCFIVGKLVNRLRQRWSAYRLGRTS